MNEKEIIAATVDFVKDTLQGAEGGHDWWHIYRVWTNAKLIMLTEPGADGFVVELASLLHDIAEAKFHNGDEEIGPRTARNFLFSLSVSTEVIDHVENIVRHVSFKNSLQAGMPWTSSELKIVQDADRLDAIGAIGIARTFNYGGHIGRSLYDPDIQINSTMSKEEYKKSTSPTINHFYEKLLLLKDMMNTHTGKKLATERHNFMVSFLEQFSAEWNGQK